MDSARRNKQSKLESYVKVAKSAAKNASQKGKVSYKAENFRFFSANKWPSKDFRQPKRPKFFENNGSLGCCQKT